MENKFLIPVIALFIGALLFGTTYSAWVADDSINSGTSVDTEVTEWTYNRDADFAKDENVYSCNYLSHSAETELFNASSEAIRLTNTGGTENKAHTVDIRFGQNFTLRNIKFHKIEFDYYIAQKRSGTNKGFPKAQMLNNTSTKGNQLGGGTTINERATFVKTDINGGDWWHLEFFMTAFCPTVAYYDSPISEDQVLNGIRITDDYINNYQSGGETVVAFVVIDNLRLSTAPTSRLGLFNRTRDVTIGGHPYWIKVAFAGVLEESRWPEENDVEMTFTSTDGGEVEQDRSRFETLFYIKGKSVGTVYVTVTVRTADGEVRSITTDKLTVKNA